MKTEGAIPYRYVFEPDYVQINEKMSQLTALAGKNPPNQPSDLIDEIMDQIRQEIDQNQLEFNTSNIYSSYATITQLNEGRKNVGEVCPGCGEEMKKQVQCQFCAEVFCKSCCWRKRVIPGLSDKKDFKTSCEECHLKFVKLLSNQKFYAEKELFMKVIQFAKSKFEKSEAKAKVKKQQTDKFKKCKTEFKIKENVLQKEVINEEKKLKAAKEKIQQVVKQKAQKIKQKERQQQQQRARQIEEKLKEAKKKQQEEEQRQRKIEQQKQQKLEQQRQQKIQKDRIKMQEQQKQAEKQKLKKQAQQNQRRQAQTKKRKRSEQIKLEQKRKRKLSQQEKAKKLRKQQQQEKKRKEIQSERKSKDFNDKKKTLQSQVQADNIKLKSEKQAPVETQEPKAQQQMSPEELLKEKQRMMKYFIEEQEKKKAERRKLIANLQIQDQPAKQDQKDDEEPIVLASSISEKKIEQNNTQRTSQVKNQTDVTDEEGAFEQLPLPAIKVSQMTVNQLLSLHVNPNQSSPGRRLSKKITLKEEVPQEVVRTSSGSIIQEDENISQKDLFEARKEILRNSLLESSNSYPKRNVDEEQQTHLGTDGQKCSCSLM